MRFRKYVLPALLVVVPVAILMTRRSRPSPSSYVLDPVQGGSDFGVTGPIFKATWPGPIQSAPVVLDPGHGGYDPGNVAPDGTKEKDLNLAQALTFKEYLLYWGYRVGLTRTQDVYVPLPERIARAKAMGARIFVSIHHDTPTATRAGVYYSPHPLSQGLARRFQAALGPGTWILPSSASHSGRLYIDDFPGPAVLIEFGPTRPVSREERMARARAVASPVVEWVGRAVI
jgi:N-acetylmuramoyl-L-alanine amidase